MARPFDFRDHVKNQAFFRQWNLCAHCGRSLIHILDNAHHLLPNQSGRPGSAGDAWIRSVDNCVMLCEACHNRVHQDGRFRAGAVAPPGYFPFSHGNNRKAHQEWAIRMKKKFWY